MDAELIRLVENDTPKVNPLIGNGLAVEHLKYAEQYIDQVFQTVAKEFPPGLTYQGGVRCTPREEYLEVSRGRNGGKGNVNLARSDIYMMKYLFKYKGEDIVRYLYLPWVSQGGTIHISGSRFTISPLLTDRVISIGVSNIFVRLLRARITFERCNQHFMMDGRRQDVQVVWAKIHNKYGKAKRVTSSLTAYTTMMHYLLCKYGFKESFRLFAGCTSIVIGGLEITTVSYPEDQWHICESTQIKPKGYRRGIYAPSMLRVAVKRDEMSQMVKNMLGGFFYVVDHIPDRIYPEFFNNEHERRMWKILMGHIIWTSDINEGKLHDDVEDHINSLDNYLDEIMLGQLKNIGINVTTIYEFFALIMLKYNDWLLGNADKISSMWDKELSVTPFVLLDIVMAIINLNFKLKAANKKDLTVKEITAIMNLTLKTGLIFRINKNHTEVSSISSSGDNKLFKITSILIPQSSSSTIGGRKDRAVLNDPSKRLHPSVAEVGGYSNLPKSEPSGRSRINPFLMIDDKGATIRNPARLELLDSIAGMIKR